MAVLVDTSQRTRSSPQLLPVSLSQLQSQEKHLPPPGSSGKESDLSVCYHTASGLSRKDEVGEPEAEKPSRGPLADVENVNEHEGAEVIDGRDSISYLRTKAPETGELGVLNIDRKLSEPVSEEDSTHLIGRADIKKSRSRSVEGSYMTARMVLRRSSSQPVDADLSQSGSTQSSSPIISSRRYSPYPRRNSSASVHYVPPGMKLAATHILHGDSTTFQKPTLAGTSPTPRPPIPSPHLQPPSDDTESSRTRPTAYELVENIPIFSPLDTIPEGVDGSIGSSTNTSGTSGKGTDICIQTPKATHDREPDKLTAERREEHISELKLDITSSDSIGNEASKRIITEAGDITDGSTSTSYANIPLFDDKSSPKPLVHISETIFDSRRYDSLYRRHIRSPTPQSRPAPSTTERLNEHEPEEVSAYLTFDDDAPLRDWTVYLAPDDNLKTNSDEYDPAEFDEPSERSRRLLMFDDDAETNPFRFLPTLKDSSNPYGTEDRVPSALPQWRLRSSPTPLCASRVSPSDSPSELGSVGWGSLSTSPAMFDPTESSREHEYEAVSFGGLGGPSSSSSDFGGNPSPYSWGILSDLERLTGTSGKLHTSVGNPFSFQDWEVFTSEPTNTDSLSLVLESPSGPLKPGPDGHTFGLGDESMFRGLKFPNPSGTTGAPLSYLPPAPNLSTESMLRRSRSDIPRSSLHFSSPHPTQSTHVPWSENFVGPSTESRALGVSLKESTFVQALAGATGNTMPESEHEIAKPTPSITRTSVGRTSTASTSGMRRKREVMFTCPAAGCGSTFTTAHNLKNHIRAHSGEKLFQCDWPGCGKDFAREPDCKRHRQLHSNYRPFRCDNCGQDFVRLGALNTHIAEVCGKSDQANVPAILEVMQNEGNAVNMEVDAATAASKAMKGSRLSEEQKELVLPVGAAREAKRSALFVCPIVGCGSTFTRSFNLKGHLRSHNEEKPFQCHWPGCGKGFAREVDCKRHEQLHVNHRPFTCEPCGKQFARMDALNRHLRSEGGKDCAAAVHHLQSTNVDAHSEFDMDVDSPVLPQQEPQVHDASGVSSKRLRSMADLSANLESGQKMGPPLLVPVTTAGPREDVAALIAKLGHIFEDVTRYKQLLACRESIAQKLLDLFQWLLNIPQLDTGFRRHLIVATQRLSKQTGLYPACYSLRDVEMVGDHPVGFGSFADIYKGSFRGQNVCMKAIRISQATQVDHFLKLCSKEAILWGQLSHPNVLPIYGLYRFQSRICLVSPWMENGDINHFVTQHPSVNRLLLAADITEGLLYLHTNGIIHGDLKGANILVTQSGRACLADFGLSSVSDAKILNWTSHSCAASKGGSLRWQAPELFELNDDEAVHNSEASDIYAWSCVCYEIFTGGVPFANISRDTAVMLQVRSGKRPQRPLATSQAWGAEGLTEAFWSLMEECWKEDPAERPSTHQILSQLSHMLPMDHRSPEDDVLSPARFRLGATVGGHVDISSFHDLDTVINGVDLESSFLSAHVGIAT